MIKNENGEGVVATIHPFSKPAYPLQGHGGLEMPASRSRYTLGRQPVHRRGLQNVNVKKGMKFHKADVIFIDCTLTLYTIGCYLM